nr:MAG TPA: hypothetical protein [Crassvirales sp.]
MKKVITRMLKKVILFCKNNKNTILLGYIAVFVTANSIDNSTIIRDVDTVSYQVNSLSAQHDELKEDISIIQSSVYDILSPREVNNQQTNTQTNPPILGNQFTLDDECTD